MTASNGENSDLVRLQRWMQAVITHPESIAEGITSEAARENLPADAANLEEFVNPSETLTGIERLAIYRRSIHLRLVECIRSMFPGLLHALGQDLLDGFAFAYLEQFPPTSYTLEHLADEFPAHLAATRPDREAPPEEREDWPDFIIDLATLERAFLDVYDGEGTEGISLPEPEAILGMEESVFLASRPHPAPCLRHFAFRFPVHRYLEAVRSGRDPELPEVEPCHVAVTRRDYRVTFHSLTKEQYRLLCRVDGSSNIADAIRCGGQPALPRVRDWFHQWTASGFLLSM